MGVKSPTWYVTTKRRIFGIPFISYESRFWSRDVAEIYFQHAIQDLGVIGRLRFPFMYAEVRLWRPCLGWDFHIMKWTNK